jgi:hypothetical protein
VTKLISLSVVLTALNNAVETRSLADFAKLVELLTACPSSR